jgi:hypothetical protein
MATKSESIYVKVHRDNKIIFLVCKTTDLVESLRKRLFPFFKVDSADIRLYLNGRVMNNLMNFVNI